MAKPRRHTDHPVSNAAPSPAALCLERLLERASGIEAGTPLEDAIEPLLDLIAELEDGGAAGLRLTGGDEERVFERRAARTAGRHDSGVPPTRSTPPGVGRLFRDLAFERRIALPGPVGGSLHFGAPELGIGASPQIYDPLLRQAAGLLSLVVRTVEGETATPTPLTAQMTHLSKLASIGQTASQIVHELNNPLTAIVAYSDYLSQALRSRDVPEGDIDRLMRINEAAVRIQRFCRELTEYSRPAAALHAPVDLREVLDRAVGFCVHGLRSADIAVNRIYQEIPPIAGVETALIQVFVNLITNAWHAMPSGGTLSLTTRTDGAWVVVEVADEGHGIDEANRARIFDAYFTTKPRGSGVGLGLSIVRQIVSDHHGEVSAVGREPRGTAFVLSFPRSSA